ncbi:MAG: hypothetical protein UU48_C0006G0007 [Candidatus Uhrbacteria bacterium GW2011_GWF2_41_16]|uniref:Uncharacterized protein n=2 Tax=Candidatus Uhriibacteriota TaxID=1752732 RepID=A0A0G0YCA8_9BACT|nr:MAG: hypothetical protein UU35_C0015G0016 [Candidatus Uhrbacteria bacterium GW2011_GWC2_41_11]KKR97967.1 MAG: hypothetical protein UU48_C0006G0007 [Candidatus Uhrbacteria bacterium GW2011_GWF2_41_16]HBP00221.1 hypothetical protein [Candidatus Uhrbacteria bacterium]
MEIFHPVDVHDHGSIRRVEGKTIVEIRGKTHLLNEPGVTCLNSDTLEGERIYQKIFLRKKIYLPDEYEQAVAENLKGRFVLVLAMNGYSSLRPQQCAAWGVQVGAYEKACEVLLTQVTNWLRQQFPDIDVRFIHGASDIGVDKVIVHTANTLRRTQLGFSCPEYMFYVKDDDVPVYVAPTVREYSDAFVRSSDILIAANGRLQAYRMDIQAVFDYDKSFIPVNVLRLISTTGGPPAKNAAGQIEDAVAHFEQRVHIIGQRRLNDFGQDKWRAAILEINDVMTNICRQILPFDIGLEVVS